MSPCLPWSIKRAWNFTSNRPLSCLPASIRFTAWRAFTPCLDDPNRLISLRLFSTPSVATRDKALKSTQRSRGNAPQREIHSKIHIRRLSGRWCPFSCNQRSRRKSKRGYRIDANPLPISCSWKWSLESTLNIVNLQKEKPLFLPKLLSMQRGHGFLMCCITSLK